MTIEKLQWKMRLGGSTEMEEVFFKIPVLYIIGDTEGHDKICGRYLSRSNIACLCRCCNIPFGETDNPEYKFKYHKHDKIMKLVNNKTQKQLKQYSMHKLSNAWKNIMFCDINRGLYGALCGDLLHCLQHGLFSYLITMLFDQKKGETIIDRF